MAVGLEKLQTSAVAGYRRVPLVALVGDLADLLHDLLGVKEARLDAKVCSVTILSLTRVQI